MQMQEFGVVYVHSHEGRPCVDGRCYEAAFAVGDTFTVVLGSDDYETRQNPKAVSLRVERIIAYEQDLEKLESGMTSRLILSGDGLDCITEDCTLVIDS